MRELTSQPCPKGRVMACRLHHSSQARPNYFSVDFMESSTGSVITAFFFFQNPNLQIKSLFCYEMYDAGKILLEELNCLESLQQFLLHIIHALILHYTAQSLKVQFLEFACLCFKLICGLVAMMIDFVEEIIVVAQVCLSLFRTHLWPHALL